MNPQMKTALDFITASLAVGLAPTLTEISEHLGLKSRSGAHRIVAALSDAGLVRFQPWVARSISLVATHPAYTRPALAKLPRRDLEALIRVAESILNRDTVHPLCYTGEDHAARHRNP